MEGQLYKWTNPLKGWQPRWLSVDHQQGVLHYYTVCSSCRLVATQMIIFCMQSEDKKKQAPRGSLHLWVSPPEVIPSLCIRFLCREQLLPPVRKIPNLLLLMVLMEKCTNYVDRMPRTDNSGCQDLGGKWSFVLISPLLVER